jgi:hypothetical protein
MFLTMVLYYYCYLLFRLYPFVLMFCNHNVSRDGSSLVIRWNLLCLVRSIELAYIGRLHLMTREEPSLETLWLQNIGTMDKVQLIDRSSLNGSIRSRYAEIILRSEVLTGMNMSKLVFWVVAPCGLVGKYHHFEGTYCLHLQPSVVALNILGSETL